MFTPCRSAADRQRHCSKPECQRARKAANNRAFGKRNPDYWRGQYNVERTRQWRREHPGYWRREGHNGGPGRAALAGRGPENRSALQAELLTQVVDGMLVAVRNDVCALQAVSAWHLAVMQGLASHLTGCALQAELGSVLNAWYDRGTHVGAAPPVNPHQPKEPNVDETPATALSGPVPADAGELQLGRSPPGA
jgi:hypothetical protein